jgi:single-strand DNA-binding protein
MADGINEVHLLGNVGINPEVRTMQTGQKVANFTLATSRSYKKDGVRHEKTEWHRIVVLNPHIVPVIEGYVRKGTRLWIRGEMRTRKWTDQKGIERYTAEIVIDFEGKLFLQDGGGSTRQDDRQSDPQKASSSASGDYNDGTGWTPPEDNHAI